MDSCTSKVKLIWEDLFGMPIDDINEDFFSLGGDSIMGYRLITAINNQFDLELETSSLMNNPTISKLGELIAQQILLLKLEKSDVDSM